MGHGGVAVTPGNSNNITMPAARQHVCVALLALSLLASNFAAVLAQSSEPPSSAGSIAPATTAGPQQAPPQSSPPPGLPAQPSQSATAPQAPAEKRGFFDNLSRWWNDSVADFNAKLKEQQSKIDDFNKKSAEAAKDAAAATQQ